MNATGLNTDTKQSVRDGRGRFAAGNKPVAGFDKQPQNRHKGAWIKERTIRAKLEKLLNDTTLGEFYDQLERNKTVNEKERLGDVLLTGWIEEIIVHDDPKHPDRIGVNSDKLLKLLEFVYGKKTENDTTLRGDDTNPIIKGFVLPTIPDSR